MRAMLVGGWLQLQAAIDEVVLTPRYALLNHAVYHVKPFTHDRHY